MADYHSKFPIIQKMPQPCMSQAVIDETMEIFSEYGLPAKVTMEDTTTQRTTKTLLGPRDLHTSRLRPTYPQSNGFVERSIQTVKNTLKKAQSSQYNSHMTLLHYICHTSCKKTERVGPFAIGVYEIKSLSRPSIVISTLQKRKFP